MAATTLVLVILLPLLVTAVVALYGTSPKKRPENQGANEGDDENRPRARLFDSSA